MNNKLLATSVVVSAQLCIYSIITALITIGLVYNVPMGNSVKSYSTIGDVVADPDGALLIFRFFAQAFLVVFVAGVFFYALRLMGAARKAPYVIQGPDAIIRQTHKELQLPSSNSES